MKTNKSIILLLFFFMVIFFSCEKRTTDVFIADSSSVNISGDYGEVTLKFKPGSMIVNQIEVIDDKSDLKIIQSIGEYGLIESEITKGYQMSQPQKYYSFKIEPNTISINDSVEIDITQQLLTNHIIRKEGLLYYIGTYENGTKVYNSLNLKVVEAEIYTAGEIKILLRNIFPFKGSFNFFYYNTKTKLEAENVGDNLYLVVYKGIKPEDSVVMLDVEIVPSSGDTLKNSTFSQRINIKQ